MEKCEDKLSDELEITNLLYKINSSYAVLRNLMRPRLRRMLKYNASAVVDIEDDESTSSVCTSSQEDEEFDADVMKSAGLTCLYKAFTLSIINNLEIDNDEKGKLLREEFKKISKESRRGKLGVT